MRRLLFVGCGGSGGVTLQYLMDQLRSDLAREGVNALPAGWQFVHVDVPLKPDGAGPGRPPSVPDQGGTYVPLSHDASTYRDVAASVEGKLAHGATFGELTTWRPDPVECTLAVTEGAGQARALGRMLVLNRVDRIHRGLSDAWKSLYAPAAVSEMRELATTLRTGSAPAADLVPAVIVVSSMAGGAGASMVIDVCRILSAATDADPNLVAVFAYTPDVFDELPEMARRGVEANSLAMLGELISAQLDGSEGADSALLAAMGIPITQLAKQPFKRLFPVGSHVGADNTPFADGTADGVYRGLARGLAGLVSSPVALDQFIGKDITNTGALINKARPHIGWAAPGLVEDLYWGSFGYASLSLGRDRYAEYAAQRLTRHVVDRLLDGYLTQPKDRVLPAVQLSQLVDARENEWVRQLWLPVDPTAVGGTPEAPTKQAIRWVRQVAESFGPRGQGPAAEGPSPSVDAIERTQRSGVSAADWVTNALASVRRVGRDVETSIDSAAYKHAYEFYLALPTLTEKLATEVAAESGLPAARAMLDTAASHARALAAELEKLAKDTPDLAAPVGDDAAKLQAVIAQTGRDRMPEALVDQLKSMLLRTTKLGEEVRTAYYLSRVLNSYADDYLSPLIDSLSESIEVLLRARAAQSSSAGPAGLATDRYAAWPSGEGVPPRFGEAHNQVVLTPWDTFEDEFRSHISPGSAELVNALDEAARTIVIGHWTDTTGSTTAALVLIGSLSRWRPAILDHDPDVGEESRRSYPPSRGAFVADVAPGVLLDRARTFVGRTDGEFATFVNEKLVDYLKSTGSDLNVGLRSSEVREKFMQAMRIARPLVSINPQMVALHHDADVTCDFKFGALPFNELPNFWQELVSDISGMEGTTKETLVAAERSLSDGNAATRIDIYGSYPGFLPIAYRSMLEPIESRWARTYGDGTSFWQWRRARRLPGFLPMTARQRRGIVGGWYVSRLIGQLRKPGDPGFVGAGIEVFDMEANGWLRFEPSVLGRSEFGDDDLALLLESFTLRLATCHSATGLEPLRPYTALRRAYYGDDEDRGDATSPPRAAGRLLGQWITNGNSPAGSAPPVAESGPPSGTADERRDAVVASLAAARDAIGRSLLPPGAAGGAAGGGRWSTITTTADVTRAPLGHEIATDMFTVLSALHGVASGVAAVPEPGSGGLTGGSYE